MSQHWTAEENRNFRDDNHMSGHIVRFNPTPEPRINADGTRSLGLRFPALIITNYVGDAAKAAQDIAAALNADDAKDKRIAELEAQLAAHPAITAGTNARAVERIARAISLSYGEDPDDYASLTLICGPNNEPLPAWGVYSEQAKAVIAALTSVTAEAVPVAGQSGEAVRKAAQAVINAATNTYRKRNGQTGTIEGEDGEMMWLIPFDPFEELRAALASVPSTAGEELERATREAAQLREAYGRQIRGLQHELDDARRENRTAREIVDAVDFFDRVVASSDAERIAVGTDHWTRLLAAARAFADSIPQAADFPQPSRKDGGEPCGECRLKPGETCDICGAVAALAFVPAPAGSAGNG